MNLTSTCHWKANHARKRKSSAAYLKEKKAKIEEELKLGSFMLKVLQTTETDTPQS